LAAAQALFLLLLFRDFVVAFNGVPKTVSVYRPANSVLFLSVMFFSLQVIQIEDMEILYAATRYNRIHIKKAQIMWATD